MYIIKKGRTELAALRVVKKTRPQRKAVDGSKGICAAAMGRSQSAPDLLESRGRVPLEEMWVAPVDPVQNRLTAAPVPSSTAPEPSASPTHTLTGFDWTRPLPPIEVTSVPVRGGESPTSALSSHLSSECLRGTISMSPHAPVTPGTGTGIVLSPTRKRETPKTISVPPGTSTPCKSRRSGGSTGNEVAPAPAKVLPHDDRLHDALTAEIKRLRERVVALEAEKSTLSKQLQKQQYEVEQRFAEIEMQICGASSTGSTSAADDRESFI